MKKKIVRWDWSGTKPGEKMGDGILKTGVFKDMKGHNKTDGEIAKELLSWYFNEIMKDEKKMRRFKEVVLPLLTEGRYKVQWDK